MSSVDWKKYAEKLPSDRSSESVEKRKKLFGELDVNGNGYLSLAEIEKGLLDVLAMEELFDCKPATMRAFQAAKGVGQDNPNAGTEKTVGAAYVERNEFRLLLQYLVDYFMLYHMFTDIDASKDRKLDKDEFTAAIQKIKDWGLSISNPAEEFEKIDTNKGGTILFDEFADWAIRKKLAIDPSPEES